MIRGKIMSYFLCTNHIIIFKESQTGVGKEKNKNSKKIVNMT